MDADATVRLLGAILWRLPALPDAACRDQDPRLFDDRVDGETPADRAERHDVAREICGRCPVRARCPDRHADRLFPRPGETKIPIAG